MHKDFAPILSRLLHKTKTFIEMLFNISSFHILNNHLFVFEHSREQFACEVRNIQNVCDTLSLQLVFWLCTKCITNKDCGDNLVHLYVKFKFK